MKQDAAGGCLPHKNSTIDAKSTLKYQYSIRSV